MLYVAVALVVYALTAIDLMRGEAPESFREALGGALACALIASVWPIALVWRGLLGGSRPDPVQSTIPASERSRSLGEA